MEKLSLDAEATCEAVEATFKEVAAKRLLQLNIPPFEPTEAMELVRSEKEIAKCTELLEKATSRKEASALRVGKNKPVGASKPAEKPKPVGTSRAIGKNKAHPRHKARAESSRRIERAAKKQKSNRRR